MRKMYWTEAAWGEVAGCASKIQCANQDGSDVENLIIAGLSVPKSIALDKDKIYWTDPVLFKIQCANLNGSDVEDLVTVGLDCPAGIALILRPLSFQGLTFAFAWAILEPHKKGGGRMSEMTRGGGCR